MIKGNILKDSFYKERLSRTSNQFIKTQQNIQSNNPSSPESDTDQQVVSPQQLELNYNQHLSNFTKTTCGTTYAFREFKCTHKHLTSLHKIHEYKFLEKIDLSFNSLKTLKYLTNLKFLTEIRATNNQLTSVLQIKQIPNHLDYVDLSHNLIAEIPELSQHKSLRVLKLNSNRIANIKGIHRNHDLRVLDLSENQIEEIQGLDGLQLTELYLSNNQIQTGKGLSKLQRLRVLNLSLNRIKKLAGFVNLVSLRELSLAKNLIKHIRQIGYLQSLMYLNEVDLSYNPLQQRKYYRLQVIYKLPMLNKLDGSSLSKDQVVKADSLYGLDVEEKYNIFKKYLTQEEFIDRRIHKSELIQVQTDSDGDNNNLVDEYDDDGQKTVSNNRYGGSKGFNGSKRSGYSKNLKNSKRSSLSKS